MKYLGKRVLVTGGAGFIGSALVGQLVEAGATVCVLDNLVNGKRENLTSGPASAARLEVGDVRDRELLRRLLGGVEVVYHLATLGVRHSLHSPEENHEVNASGALRLLLESRAAGVARFVHVSTSEVYGTALQVPMTEEHPTLPTTVYGASKLAGECYARAFYQSHGFPVVVVRPFNAYGPRSHHEGDSGEVIPRFMLRGLAGRPMVVFGDGTQTRDFSYVEDTASGILAAGLADGVLGETINLGNGRETAIGDLATAVARALALDAPRIEYQAPRPGDVHRHCADGTRAARLLGYRPRVSLVEGLSRLRDWYQGLGQPIEDLLAAEVLHNWDRPCPR